jgi:hypothetical protein
MENLDLDINNYTIYDLENFFRLKKRKKYTVADIELKEYEIREQLLQSGHIDKRHKTNLINFLDIAKKKIISEKCIDEEHHPTTIPKNYKLDNYNVPYPDNTTASREHNLLNRPVTEYVYTSNSDFLPGRINPINTRVITKCVNIDTRFRETLHTTQSSDFTVQLTTKFSKVVSMELSALELPLSFYGISRSNGNNFLYLNVNHNTKDASANDITINTDKVFIIPDGNYNSNDFIEVINKTICPLDQNQNMLEPQSIFSYIRFTVNLTSDGSGSGKVSVSAVGNEFFKINSITLDFTRNIDGIIDNIDISKKIGWNLGFRQAIYIDNYYYHGESIIEPKNNRYVYLSVDDFNKNSNSPFISIFNQSILNDDILARISIKGSHFSMLLDNDMSIVSEPRIYFGPVDIQRLRIRLFDEHGRILNMNNTDFSFCLKIKTMYDL